MPRYFLNIRDATGLVTDHEGLELPDLAAARIEALEGARCIMAEKVRNGLPVGRQSFEIMDEAGKILACIPLRTALDLS